MRDFILNRAHRIRVKSVCLGRWIAELEFNFHFFNLGCYARKSLAALCINSFDGFGYVNGDNTAHEADCSS